MGWLRAPPLVLESRAHHAPAPDRERSPWPLSPPTTRPPPHARSACVCGVLHQPGCSYESSGLADVTCEGDAQREGYVCQEGVWVRDGSPPPEDMDECVPESDAQLCQQQQVACGPLDGVTDRCGAPRSVADCGACPDDQTCSASGACEPAECVPEEEEVLCGARECGPLEVTDRCGQERTVDCGGCEQGQTCSVDGQCACIPLSGPELCAQLGACGDLEADDGCGQLVSLECGNPCDPNAEVCDPETQRCVCQPETDEVLCGRRGQDQGRSSCGVVDIEDRCGELREVDCGGCGDQGGECGLDHFCTGCRPETRAQLCDRLGAGCDELSAEDNCGQLRTVDCGGCDDDRVCQDNQCACPDPTCPGGAECGAVSNACGNSTGCGSCSGGGCATRAPTPAFARPPSACGTPPMCGTCNQGENWREQPVLPAGQCGGRVRSGDQRLQQLHHVWHLR